MLQSTPDTLGQFYSLPKSFKSFRKEFWLIVRFTV